jgi:acyl-CoA thioester hydrolase
VQRTHEYKLQILEFRLDTFGHVNNAVYLDLFEEARWALIHGNGYGLETIREYGKGPTMLEINLRFQREIKNRERITIKTWTEAYAGKVGTMVQEMVNEAGETCCVGRFVFGLFDTSARKLVAPTPAWLRGLGVSEVDSEA